MQTWITELRQLGPQNLVLAIAGNKVDLDSQRRVSMSEGGAGEEGLVKGAEDICVMPWLYTLRCVQMLQFTNRLITCQNCPMSLMPL